MNFKRFSAGLLSLIIAGSLCTAALADNYTEDIELPYDTSVTLPEIDIPQNDISLQADEVPTVNVLTIDINSVEDLKEFRDDINSSDESVYIPTQLATVNLNCDIDLGGEEWVPIGYAPDDEEHIHSFQGTFNGNGHKISNFKITKSDYPHIGFFAMVWNTRKSSSAGYENDISISNLTLDNAKIDIKDSTAITHVGILAGTTYLPSIYKNISVTNSKIDIEKTGYDDEKNPQVSCGLINGSGSFAAYDCNAQGDINIAASSSVFAGGITGLDDVTTNISSHTYSNCTSAVNITTSAIYQNIVGGIAGYVRENIPITNCSYNADNGINISCTKNEAGSAQAYAGGITGHCYSSISDCTVKTSNINSTSEQVAGAAGITVFNNYDIKNCIVNSDLTANATEGSNLAEVGGIVCIAGPDTSTSSPTAKNNSVIENCVYNGGNITANSYLNVISGGLVARLSNEYTLKNSYAEFDNLNTTSVGAKASKPIVYAGGLVGNCQGSDISNCFSKGDISAESTYTIYAGGLTGRIGDLTYYYTDTSSETAEATVEAIHSPGTLTNSYTTSNVTALGNTVYAGGITGILRTDLVKIESNSQSSRITKSHSSGDVDVTAAAASLVGGGIGYTIDSYIADCYSTGDLTIEPTAAAVYGGGFVGRLKEANIAWENTENPLSQTLNCYTAGNVITDASSAKVYVGPFTQASVSNSSQKPAVEVAPIYDNCYYVSEEGTENAVGENISSVTDKNSFDFDFENTWKMTENGPTLLAELPEVFDVDYTYENGEPIKINSVSIGKPNEVSKIYITSTNTVTNAKTVTSYDVQTPSVFEKYFKTIDIDYEASPLTTVDVTTTAPFEVTESKLENNVFTAKITNNLDTDETILNFAAAYGSNGALTGTTSNSVVLKAGETTNIELTVPDNTSKIFMWDSQNMCPILPTIKF